MNIQAPTVMPKWEYMTPAQKERCDKWESGLCRKAMRKSEMLGKAINIFLKETSLKCSEDEYREIVFLPASVETTIKPIGSATKNGCMLDNMAKYYAMKYL
jgi:hypothetical protein